MGLASSISVKYPLSFSVEGTYFSLWPKDIWQSCLSPYLVSDPVLRESIYLEVAWHSDVYYVNRVGDIFHAREGWSDKIACLNLRTNQTTSVLCQPHSHSCRLLGYDLSTDVLRIAIMDSSTQQIIYRKITSASTIFPYVWEDDLPSPLSTPLFPPPLHVLSVEGTTWRIQGMGYTHSGRSGYFSDIPQNFYVQGAVYYGGYLILLLRSPGYQGVYDQEIDHGYVQFYQIHLAPAN